ncbi:hypothetical protein [uncultured Psychroserpens sp.]|uniref:hypothetical protein n=1 Tax=uncultured Psychroserpens sp. TaxID=255436 RepID=UPI00261DF013|nr:hypothetical protein [uncultured Psychroserpens sp.]
MRRLLYICFIGLLAFSCDDGDVFEVELLFDEELELCGDENSQEYLLYDIKTDPNESLSLKFPVNTANNAIFNPSDNTGEPYTLDINGTTIAFNYRTYDGNPENLICQIIPVPGTTITNDYEAASGATVEFISTYEDDDNDGIPSDLEGRGAQAEDGSYPNAIDSDGDGIPDYIDEDDDNDNVPTAIEEFDPNEDGDITDALDTDNDGTPNYLDNDDDGDGVLTADEDENDNLSLTDDFDFSNGVNNTPRYLDSNAVDEYIQDEFIDNEFTRLVTVEVTILEANIEIINIQPLFLGTYTNTLTFSTED